VETIVLGFDGSEASTVALDWVAERAAGRPTHVEIVKIGGTLLQDDDGRDIGLVEAEHRVRDRAPDAEIESHRLVGKMPDALLDRARGADLVVVGARRGRAIWSTPRWMPLRVASRSRTPVVVVPDDWDPTTGRVVVGLDDDDSSGAAEVFAAREAAHARTPLALVHTWTMPHPQMEGSVALLASPIEARAVQRRILRDAAARAQAAHPDLVIEQILEQSNPASALLRAAHGASLLVLGTHHRGPLTGAVLGSIGHDVLSQCRTPVCVVPGDEPT
jgi:nucleotide-binding universal stress UspA family protein